MQFSVQENEFLQLLILTPTAFGKLSFYSHLIDFHVVVFFAKCKEMNNLLEHVKPCEYDEAICTKIQGKSNIPYFSEQLIFGLMSVCSVIRFTTLYFFL